MSNNIKVLILAVVGVLIIVGAILFDRSRTLSLSETVLSINPGETQSINVKGIGDFVVTDNINPEVAAPFVKDGGVEVSAYTSGSTTFSVCDQEEQPTCIPVYVTVNYSSTTPFANVTPTGTSNSVFAPASTTVALNAVPYTGLSSSAKVYLFVLGMALWSGGISYFLVRRKALSK